MMWLLLAVAACGDPEETGAKLLRIEVTPANPHVPAGLTQQLTATGVFSDSKALDVTSQVSWSSSAGDVATVSAAGEASGVAAGSVTITASMGGVRGEVALTVSSAQLLAIEVTPTNPKVPVGRTQQLTATGLLSDDSTLDLTRLVTWTSDAEARVTVGNADGARGKVEARAVGDATVTATLESVSGSTTLTVTGAVLESIAVTPATPSVALGRTQQLTATGTFSDASTQDLTADVSWVSDNEAAAKISNVAGSNGLATTFAKGAAKITATLEAISGSATLTVTDAVLVSIAVTPGTPSVPAGRTEQLTATGTFSDSSEQDLTAQVLWSSDNEAAATISNAAGSNGLATTFAKGAAKITATLDSIEGAATLTVTDAVLVSIAVTPGAPSVAAGRTQQFTATGTFSDSSAQDLTAQVTWSSDDEAAAKISSAAGTSGLATALAKGAAKITAKQDSIEGSATLTVTDAVLVSLAVTPGTPSVAAGRTQQLTATGTFSDNSEQNLTTLVSWSSDNEAAATISNEPGTSGLATTLAKGEAKITATLGALSGSATLTVTDAVLVSLAVKPVDPSVLVAHTVQLTATGTFSDGSTEDLTTQVTWSSETPTIADVSDLDGEQGRVLGLAAGSTKITATLGELTGTTTVTVTEEVPPALAFASAAR